MMKSFIQARLKVWAGILACFAVLLPEIAGQEPSSAPKEKLVAETFVQAVMQDENPTMMFKADQEQKFVFQKPFPGISYKITDVYGRTVASGQAGEQGFLLEKPLPRGYYRICLESPKAEFIGERCFGVVPDPADRKPGDYPYAACISIFGTYPADGDRQKGVRVMGAAGELLGVRYTRSMIQWLERSPGDFHGFPDYQYICRNWNEHGMKGITIYTEIYYGNNWIRKNPNAPYTGENHPLPHNLIALYNYTKTLAKNLPAVTAWEFGNEMDQYIPWDVAALQKAAYLGFKAANPDAIVTPGGFYSCPFTNNIDQMFRNDMGEYADALNYHIYDSFRTYPKAIQNLRDLLATHGIANQPTWITENGTNNTTGPATLTSVHNPKNLVYDKNQELIWAELVPKAQIRLQFLGVARTFTFILRHHQEGVYNWGLLREDFSCKPAAITFATLTNELGDAKCLGKVALNDFASAFLFARPDGSQSLAVWVTSRLDNHTGDPLSATEMENIQEKTIELKSAVPVRCIDGFGNEVRISPRNGTVTIPVNRYVSYVHGLRGLKAAESAHPTTGKGENRSFSWDKTVIFQADPGTDPAVLRLNIYNLSDQKKTGKVNVNHDVDGLPEIITLDPMAVKCFDLKVRRKPGEPNRLVFIGDFNGKRTSCLDLPLITLGIKDEIPAPNAVMDPEQWSRNSSGTLTISRDEKEQALRMEAHFEKGSGWCYPGFNPKKIGVDLTGYAGMSFEMKAVIGKNAKPACYLAWITREGIPGSRVPINESGDRWTKSEIVFPANPEQIVNIGVGLNPTPAQKDLVYYIRNIKFLK